MGVVADQEVRSLRKKGIQAWLACPKAKGRQGMEHIIEVPALGIGNGSLLRGLVDRLKNADVVHLHYPYYGTAEEIAYYKKKGIIKHLVMTLHMDAQADGARGLLFDVHRKYIQPKILACADLVFVSSLDYAEHSSYKTYMDANPQKVVELPFGVDTNCFSCGEPNRNRFGIPSGSCVIGTVSVQDKAHVFKGIDLLIKAMAALPEHVHLLLVGDGDMQSTYRRLANDLNVANRVHFAGKLNHEDLVCAYRTMDVFAFPSKNSAEAFGLVVLEAMACGVPVVASELPGVRGVAQNAGFLIPPNNIKALVEIINKMAEDPELCHKFKESARQKALQYSWDHHTQVLIEQYQKLCA
jgi:glycosyltransferase involved in cell wall biosynthesis